ncbi:hypothetical protein M1D80_09490 [Phyllobacteriaceae bacterium JZ32]
MNNQTSNDARFVDGAAAERINIDLAQDSTGAITITSETTSVTRTASEGGDVDVRVFA